MSGIKSTFKAWWQASRPAFYVATLIPLSLAFVVTVKNTGRLEWSLFGLILLASFFVHFATNLANDLFDHWQGIDAGPNIGGSRVIQEGKISLVTLASVTGLLYALALLLAVVIVQKSGQNILWALIIFAGLSSFFYVAPPIKYGHRALGELFVFLNMGLIMVSGAYLALAQSFTPSVVALALPGSFMTAGILYFQNLPEIETDLLAGKRTVANYLGKERARLLYLLWWPLVWLLMVNLWLCGLVHWVILLGLLSCPLHIQAYKKIKALGDGDWLPLDAHGHLVRKLALINGVLVIVAVGLK